MSSGKPETITIDDVKYVQADSVKQQLPSGPVKILVLDRGFVYVGRLAEFGEEGRFERNGVITLNNAYNIRYWGTKNGLGDLVNGPLKETKLDFAGVVTIPIRALIHMIDVDAKKWPTI